MKKAQKKKGCPGRYRKGNHIRKVYAFSLDPEVFEHLKSLAIKKQMSVSEYAEECINRGMFGEDTMASIFTNEEVKNFIRALRRAHEEIKTFDIAKKIAML